MFKVIICDDEKEKAKRLHFTLNRITAELPAKDKIEFFMAIPEKLANYKIDAEDTYLFMLDIAYKNISGIDIAINLRAQHKDVYIIFITTHPDLVYTTVNQNVMPSGFLMKPPVENELKNVFMSVYEYYEKNKKYSENVITIASGANVYKFSHSEIYYIEALNKKINIYTKAKRITCYSSLAYLQEELNESFIRCHKSYLVNKDKVKNIYMSEMYIELQDGSKVPLSRTFKSAVKKIFNE